MQETLDVLRRLAKTDVTVALTGETGSGKELLARAVHFGSPRCRGPLVVFDCGSVTPTLAESELLGHERGAFTGALNANVGAFERAHGGTVFLDEIGELPLDLQPRLLRLLENRTVRRVGGRTDKRVDVRVVAATNRCLRTEVEAGRFRRDLYYRLAAAVVRVPPLRERPDDIPLLVPSLLKDLGCSNARVTNAALAALESHPWPGNVRELKNVLAYALAFTDNGVIDEQHVRFTTQGGIDVDRMPLHGQRLDRIERAAIKQTLAQTRGNKVQAAKSLGIALSTLYEKLKKCDIEVPPSVRPSAVR
jgi:DNA-binding NtrC family response regulator